MLKFILIDFDTQCHILHIIKIYNRHMRYLMIDSEIIISIHIYTYTIPYKLVAFLKKKYFKNFYS